MTLYGNEDNRTILTELGQRIRDNRLSANITQAELSDRSGVALRTIIRMEKGESIQIESMLNVLRVLGVLGNLDLLIREQKLSSADSLKKRRRASKAKKKDAEMGN